MQVGSSCEGMLQLLQQEVPHNAVTVEYPQHTFAATPACSSHSGTVLYESYIAGQRNLDVYNWLILEHFHVSVFVDHG